MGCKHAWRYLGVLVLGVALAPAWGQGAGPVKVDIKAGKTATGQDVINISFDIEKTWHIYANPVGLDDFAAAATIVKVESKGKVNAEVKYPAGKDHEEKGIGTLKVYEGKVTIPVLVQRADQSPLEVTVRYQACDPKKCLPPATVKQTVP